MHLRSQMLMQVKSDLNGEKCRLIPTGYASMSETQSRFNEVRKCTNFNKTALNATTALKCNKQKEELKMCSEHQVKSQ